MDDEYHEYECPECSKFYQDCICFVCPNCGDLDVENVGQVNSKQCCISCGEYLITKQKGEKHV